MNIGDYVRTKRGQIYKITDLKAYYENGKLIEDRQLVHIENHFSGWDLGQFKELIIKSSPNIIDLIEVGDYVNGLKVSRIGGTYHGRKDKAIYCDYCEDEETRKWTMIYDDEIKSIVTKEQFKEMEYKI